MKHLPVILLSLAFALHGGAGAQEDGIPEDLKKKLIQAYHSKDFDQVLVLTEGAGPESPLLRVRASALQSRGEEHFFEAKIAESIADFDACLAIRPEQDAHHWQRGLSYYYAEEYEKGKAQFERHQTVNSQDVENAVWHFLCAVRAPGGSVEEARQALIPIERDTRIPMKEVHDLFAGRGSAEAVLEAAKEDGDGILSDAERNHLCYAHLYLGLYYEALGEEGQSTEHIRKAAYDYAMDHYMGKTAQVHAKLRGIGEGE